MEKRHLVSQLGISRRDLIKGGAAFLMTSCAGPQKDLKDPSQFDMKAFVSWYRRNKLYNGPNPNLRRPHSANNRFLDMFQKRYSPGVDYSVPAGEMMVAVAPGVVTDIGEITGTGRPGGTYVVIDHGESYYRSNFSHVATPVVNLGERVVRGQPISAVPLAYSGFAKLMVYESFNYVDPDNYGPNHSFMQYQEGTVPMDKEYAISRDLLRQRYVRQQEIMFKFNKQRLGWDNYDVMNINDLFHNKGGYKPTLLSVVERFRFYETLFQMHPHQFPNLDKEAFETMRKEFYENQPIILTLPFKMGGMR